MKKKIMSSFRRILAEVGRNEMLMMGLYHQKVKKQSCQGMSLIFKSMGKKSVSSFRNVLAKVGENWIEAMKYYNYPR